VLGTPPALIMSQDQTLKLKLPVPLSENQTRLTQAHVDDLALTWFSSSSYEWFAAGHSR
jgi:hypothetical protein